MLEVAIPACSVSTLTERLDNGDAAMTAAATERDGGKEGVEMKERVWKGGEGW